jgi:hypothetical protein
MRSATIALHTVAAGAVIELFGHIALGWKTNMMIKDGMYLADKKRKTI